MSEHIPIPLNIANALHPYPVVHLTGDWCVESQFCISRCTLYFHSNDKAFSAVRTFYDFDFDVDRMQLFDAVVKIVTDDLPIDVKEVQLHMLSKNEIVRLAQQEKDNAK